MGDLLARLSAARLNGDRRRSGGVGGLLAPLSAARLEGGAGGVGDWSRTNDGGDGDLILADALAEAVPGCATGMPPVTPG